MIHNEPLPFLESAIFLANRALGFSWKTHIESIMDSDPQNRANAQTLEYGRILSELEERLENSITASEDSISYLFSPLNKSGNKSALLHSSYYIGNLLISNEIDMYQMQDNQDFIDGLYRGANSVARTIAKSIVSETQQVSKDISFEELFRLINGSGLESDSKILLADVALESRKYIDMLIETLIPVADEFRCCRELIQPLLDVYTNTYKNKNAEKILRKTWGNSKAPFSEFIMYPLIMNCPNSLITMDDSVPPRMLGCIGVLNDFFLVNYKLNKNNELNLYTLMSSLGNKNRLGIIERLLEGSAYGRELANHLNLSPGAISQHIGVLVGVGLVTVHNESVRAYYSINKDNVRRFVDRMNSFFGKI